MTAQLPKGWRYDRVKDHFRIVSGSGFKVDLQGATDGDYPMCKASDIRDARHVLTRSANFVSREIVEREKFNVIPAGSILFAKIGEAMKKNNRAIAGVDCCVDNNCQGLIPNKIDSAFSYYCFRCIDMRQFDNGGTIPYINNQKLRMFKIPLPPRPEQERIAAFLDAKCADVDKAIAAKRRQLEGIDGIWNNVLVKAVTLGLYSRCTFIATGDVRIPQMPKGWRLEKIARCFDLIGSGTTPKSHMQDYYDGNIPWLQSGDLHGRYVDHTEKYVNETACRDCNLRIYRAPFIAVAMYGASIANLSIVRIDACTNQACCTLCLPRHLIDPDFAYFAVSASREALLQSAHGGTQPNISREVVRRLKIALPPKSEQVEIAKYLDKRRVSLDALAANLRRQIETLEEYRKSLIHEYVTGARRVT